MQAAAEDKKKQQPSQTTLLVASAATATVFHCGDMAYATVRERGHEETHAVKSRSFRLWLVGRFYREHGHPPTASAIVDALSLVEARALYDGSETTVSVRVAELDGAIFIDLADTQWRTIRVDAKEWCIVENCPVRFLRPRGMLALPTPARGGRVDDLRQLVNVEDDQTWALVVAWLVAALRPRGPYPILCVNGEQGSAKSTLCRMLRALVDPNGAPLRAEPKEPRDLMIGAGNAWVLAFDNLSHLPPWLSDALCRLSTGGGFATRELYSDDAERIFDSMRPLMVNGIEDLATRSDLLDRAVTVTLPSIPEHRRRSEADLWRDFYRAAPGMLGALLGAVSTGIRNLPSIRLSRLPRMADFAIWATACESSLGLPSGAFLAAYSGNREQANQTAIEASPVGPVLLAFLASRECWTGTARDLLSELSADRWSDDKTRRQRGWPQTSRKLGADLRRLAPNLRASGFDVAFDREAHSGRRIVTIHRGVGGDTVTIVTTVTDAVSEPETAFSGDDRVTMVSEGDGRVTMAGSNRHQENPPGAVENADGDKGDDGDDVSPLFSGDDDAPPWTDDDAEVVVDADREEFDL